MQQEEIINTLKKACEERKFCRVQLTKEPSARIVQPHGICNCRRQKPVLVCVQTSGYSKSGKLPQFRNLPLDSCEEVEILDKKFRIHPNFDPLDGQYDEWLFHV